MKFESNVKPLLHENAYENDLLTTSTVLFVAHELSHPPPPSATYMGRWTGSVLVQIMACRLFGAKTLSKLMLEYCQLDPYEQTSVKFQSKYKTIHSTTCNWKFRLRNGGHFVQGPVSQCRRKLDSVCETRNLRQLWSTRVGGVTSHWAHRFSDAPTDIPMFSKFPTDKD